MPTFLAIDSAELPREAYEREIAAMDAECDLMAELECDLCGCLPDECSCNYYGTWNLHGEMDLQD